MREKPGHEIQDHDWVRQKQAWGMQSTVLIASRHMKHLPLPNLQTQCAACLRST